MFNKLKSAISDHTQKRLEEKVKKTPYPTPGKFHYISFKYAFDGILWAVKAQPNFKIHLFVFALLCIFLFYLNLFVPVTAIEWSIILLASALVFLAELINTALEALSDEVADGKYKDYIRVAKDCASGAVLVVVLFAIAIGIIVIWPKIELLL